MGKKFDDLHAETAEESDKKLIDLTKFWKDITVHGFAERDPVTGVIKIKAQTDLDGRAFLAILQLVGIDTSKVEYVAQGPLPESKKSGVAGDFGLEQGVVAKNRGELLIDDHHSEKSGKDTSAAKNIYKAFVESGILKKTKALDNFIEFVTKEDNKGYTDEECRQIVENFESNLIGLQRYMTGEQLIKVFQDYAKKGEVLNPYERLSDDYLSTLNFATQHGMGQKMNLENVSNKLKNIRDSVKRELEKMIEAGFVVDTGDRYGKILIDTGKVSGKSRRKRLGSELGIETARAAGYGGIIFWNPEANNFSIQTAKEFDFELEEGFNSRGHYWLKIPGKEN